MKEEKSRTTNQKALISKIRDRVSLIDFNASWCIPCREQRPIINRLAEKFRGKAFVFDLNVDDYPDPAVALGVTSIPTLIVFKEGNEFKGFIGIQTEETLTHSLEEALNDIESAQCQITSASLEK